MQDERVRQLVVVFLLRHDYDDMMAGLAEYICSMCCALFVCCAYDFMLVLCYWGWMSWVFS